MIKKHNYSEKCGSKCWAQLQSQVCVHKIFERSHTQTIDMRAKCVGQQIQMLSVRARIKKIGRNSCFA